MKYYFIHYEFQTQNKGKGVGNSFVIREKLKVHEFEKSIGKEYGYVFVCVRNFQEVSKEFYENQL